MDSASQLSIDDFIRYALYEDEGEGDQTSLACIEPQVKSSAFVKVKEIGIIAGVGMAIMILESVDENVEIEILKKDGDNVNVGDLVLKLYGNTRSILKAERLLLNCMQRMSGIATKTNNFVKQLRGTKAQVLDTRKTTPNFRYWEKLAVKIGGGSNHRFGLYDMILIKDNHIDASGGIIPAIKKVNEYLAKNNKQLKIEVETRNIEEVQQVLHYGNVHRIMADNFSIENLTKAVQLVNGRFEVEASGSITEENIREVAETGVDYISVGALTHSYKSLDLSLKIEKA
jgi:nicotinate-nucleotide pyrophosphorylase (carboxylating)